MKIQEIAFKGIGSDGNLRGEYVLRPDFEHLATKDGTDVETPPPAVSTGNDNNKSKGTKRKLKEDTGPAVMTSAKSVIPKKSRKQKEPSLPLPPATITAAVLSGPSEPDEDLPPKPRSAFEIFCDENREKAKLKCKTEDLSDMKSTLTKMWARIPVDDREYYLAEAENEEARYANARNAIEGKKDFNENPNTYSIPKKKSGYSIPKRKSGDGYSIPKKKHYH